jgi:fructokinase
MNESFDAVCFGEVLWDVLPSGAKPGGAPMNVAYHLQKLGISTALISKVGNDDRGTVLLNVLQKSGLTTRYVQTDPDHSTGLVNATLQANNEVSYDIVHPVAWDFIVWEEKLNDLVKSASFFIYGSLAARNAVSSQTLRQLIASAQTKVVDINLRPPHFSKELVESLLKDADIVKLNEHELALITGWYSGLQKEEDQVKFLQDHFFVSTLVVTRGGRGALVCTGGEILFHPGYKVTVADTIGSGDAFLAAFLYQTRQGANPEDRLQFANKLGAFIASRQGACPSYSLEEVMGMGTKDAVEE